MVTSWIPHSLAALTSVPMQMSIRFRWLDAVRSSTVQVPAKPSIRFREPLGQDTVERTIGVLGFEAYHRMPFRPGKEALMHPE